MLLTFCHITQNSTASISCYVNQADKPANTSLIPFHVPNIVTAQMSKP